MRYLSGTIELTLSGRTYKHVGIAIGHYFDGSTAIRLFTQSGEPLIDATVSLAGSLRYPADGCVFVKDYSEGAGLMDAFENLGLMERTGNVEVTGWVNVPEARLKGELAIEALKESGESSYE